MPLQTTDQPGNFLGPLTVARHVGEESRVGLRCNIKLRLAAVLIALGLVFVQPASSQVYSGSITGVVTDPSGAVVPDARVVLTDVTKGYSYSATTNTEGTYTIRSVPPGAYELTVTAKGFRTFVQSGITLAVTEHATVDVKLEVGASAQTVTVTGAAPLLATRNATTGQSVTRTLINDLPLISRSVYDLAYLSPGVNPAAGRAFGPGDANNFTSNGGRGSTADVLLDGVTTSAPNANTTALTPLYVPSVDAVQEFKVEQNNFSADKGFSGNTVVNVIIRSGTNQFHGSVYEFLRNDKLDANSWFNNRAGLKLPPLRRNDFGFTFGGPIKKNKLFFFADYEGVRQRGLQTYTSGNPSPAEREGNFGELCAYKGGTFDATGMCSNPDGQLWDPYTSVFDAGVGGPVRSAFIPFNNMATYTSPGSSLAPLPQRPGNLIDPVAQKMMSFYPAINVGSPAVVSATGDVITPASPGYNPFNNWAGTGATISSDNHFDIKIDAQINDRTMLSGRFSMQPGGLFRLPNVWNNPLFPGTQGPNKSDVWSGVINFTRNISSTTLFTVSAGYTRWTQRVLGVNSDFPGFNAIKELGLPSYMATSGQFMSPAVYITDYNQAGANNIGAGAWQVFHFALESYDLMASLDKLSGRHEFKFGGEMRVFRDNFSLPGTPNGLFDYFFTGTSKFPWWGGGDAMASFLTGVGGPGSWGRYSIDMQSATQNFQYGGYAQDNWRVTNKLTLNPGIRYELYIPRTERFNRQSWFNPDAVSPLSVPGMPPLKGGLEFTTASNRHNFPTIWTNFEPRLGLAYRLREDTVLRAGYGIFSITPISTAAGAVEVGWDGFNQVTSWLTTFQGNGFTPFGRLSDPFPNGILLPPGSSNGLLTNLGLGLTAPLRNWGPIPYMQTWSFGVQRQFGSVLVDATYVGTKGTHLNFAGAGERNILPPSVENFTSAQIADLVSFVPNPFFGIINTPGCGICGPTIQKYRLQLPFPQFSSVNLAEQPWANSIYNALQVRAEKKFSNGLEFLGNYTWAKSIDDASIPVGGVTYLGGFQSLQDPNKLSLERSLSEYDIPHVLSFAYIYQLPFGHGKHWGNNWGKAVNAVLGGWQTQGFWRFDAGQPLALSLSGGQSLPTYGVQRPNLVGTLKKNNCDETCMVSQYFANPEVAVKPAPYAIGTAPRTIGSVRAPGTQSANLSVFKQISIEQLGKAGKLEVRAESFNALNHVQFCGPNTTVNSRSFGLVSCQANLPREVQLALKLYF